MNFFRVDRIVKRWAGVNVASTIIDLDRMKVVTKWLDDDVLSTLSTSDQEWASSVVENTANLFRPILTTQGQLWLRFNTDEREMLYGIYEAFTCILRVMRELEGLKPSFDPEKVSVQEIRSAARLVGFDEDSLWHTEVALSLLQYDHYGEAVAEAEIAVELNPSSWRAR